MKPLVSIVIPIYNAEKYLAECLDSICSQTLREIEIICVNDGSTDGSAAVLSMFAEKDDRIRVISQPNGGELAARNTGIKVSSGKWLGFIDSDDSAVSDMFERLLKNGEQYQADISHCGIMFCYPDGRDVPHYGTGSIRQQEHETGLLDLLDGTQIEPSMCSKLYRSELFHDFNVSDRIDHNGDFFCNFILFGKAKKSVYEDFCGYRYRQRHNVRQSVNTLMDILSIRQKVVGLSSGPIRDAAYRLWLSTLVNTLNQISVSSDKEAPVCYSECLDLLKAEQKNIAVLSKKQRIAANLHLKHPKSARMIYQLYGKYSQFRYEH